MGMLTDSVHCCLAGLGFVALLLTRKRKRQHKVLKEYEPGMQLPELSGDAGERAQIHASEIEICKREDGSDWVLGSGSFGKVYKGLRRGIQEVAVKKLVCDTPNDVWRLLLAKEIDVLKSVSYDRNIVQYYGACLEDQASAMLVMEYMAVRANSGRPVCAFWSCTAAHDPIVYVLVCLVEENA